MALPTIFPIFPLDTVVLVPGAMLPLHIFEPRYRQMIADVMAGERALAMAMPLAGVDAETGREPRVHPVVGLGRIVRHESLPEGRANIILRGIARMRIVEELPSDHPYRVVRAGALPDAPLEIDLVPRVAAAAARTPGLDAAQIATLARGDASAAVNLILLTAQLAPRETHRLHAITDVVERLAALERILDARQGRHRLDITRGDPRLN